MTEKTINSEPAENECANIPEMPDASCYSGMFDNFGDAVLIFGFSGRLIYSNPAADALFSLNEDGKENVCPFMLDKKIGTSIFTSFIASVNNVPHILERFSMASETGADQIYTAECVNNAAEKVCCIYIRKNTVSNEETDIISGNEKFRNIAELLPHCLFELDGTGRFLYANKPALALFDVTEREFRRGASLRDKLIPADQPRADEYFQKVMVGAKTDESYEFRMRRIGGAIVTAKVNLEAVTANGKIVGCIGTGEDVTEEKKMQKAIHIGEERLNIAMNSADICVWDWDMQADVLSIAGNYEAMLGFSTDNRAAADIRWREIMQVEVISKVMGYFAENESSDNAHLDPEKHTFSVENPVRTVDGESKWIYIIGKIVRWETDESGYMVPLHIIGIIQDITRMKSYTTALSNANKKLNMLASITRHDILNQIAGINGFTDILLKRLQDNPEYVHHLERIKQSSKNIQDQMLFTKSYHKVGVTSPSWQNLRRIVEKMKENAMIQGISIISSCGNVEIYADPMLEMIFFNMLDNAVRHGMNVTEMTVSFEQTGKFSEGHLIIADNGSGVPDKIKPRIFDHGYGKHTGMGLFLTKEILEITGLEISENGVEGKGARFDITVPRGSFRLKE